MKAENLVTLLASAKHRLILEGQIPKKKDGIAKHDKPFVIPDTWVWKQLADVSIIQEGPGIRKYQYNDKGIQFLTVTNILDGTLDLEKSKKYISEVEYFNKYQHFKINAGDIVTACSGATWGKSAMFEEVNKVMILNTSTLRLRFFDDICVNKYLYYYTKNHHFKNQLSIYQTGQQPNYGYSHYSLIHTPIPPLEEQQKIVEKLDKAFELLDQAKANIEKNIQNAKELFQSKLDEVFSQQGEGWQEMSLGDLGKVSMCKRILKSQTLPIGDIPFYKIGTFGKNADAFITKELFDEYSSKYSYPKKGQILLSASGTIGRTVVFDGKPSFFQDSNIVWIDNEEDKVLNEFLYHFYKVCDWNPSRGATISRLYNDDLRRIKINFPSIEMQKRLIPKLQQLQLNADSVINIYQQKLSNIEELRKSILEKAFKGELTN